MKQGFGKWICILLLVTVPVFSGWSWGFFAHKAINRLAVFTLPSGMFGFYKTHIEYLTTHAVDPDKRRYTDTTEACRHYIDLDRYESIAPIDTLPMFWKQAVAAYTEDTLLAYGIVPWHIQRMLANLTQAFSDKNTERILKYSAEIGHYIADACVPLHATMNYNGQLTGQHGIHGFWESRLPELYFDQYDFFVGKASYIENPLLAAWQASESSFAAKDSVLFFEQKLNARFLPEQKYELVPKGQKTIKQYSTAYSREYHTLLSGQVERRMRLSVALVGSFWYTAWVNAGKPDLPESTSAKPEQPTQLKLAIEEEQHLMFKEMLGRQE